MVGVVDVDVVMMDEDVEVEDHGVGIGAIIIKVEGRGSTFETSSKNSKWSSWIL